jgi:hypothetical protein
VKEFRAQGLGCKVHGSTCTTMECRPPSLAAGALDTTVAVPHSKSFQPARGANAAPCRRRRGAAGASGKAEGRKRGCDDRRRVALLEEPATVAGCRDTVHDAEWTRAP